MHNNIFIEQEYVGVENVYFGVSPFFRETLRCFVYFVNTAQQHLLKHFGLGYLLLLLLL